MGQRFRSLRCRLDVTRGRFRGVRTYRLSLAARTRRDIATADGRRRQRRFAAFTFNELQARPGAVLHRSLSGRAREPFSSSSRVPARSPFWNRVASLDAAGAVRGLEFSVELPAIVATRCAQAPSGALTGDRCRSGDAWFRVLPQAAHSGLLLCYSRCLPGGGLHGPAARPPRGVRGATSFRRSRVRPIGYADPLVDGLEPPCSIFPVWRPRAMATVAAHGLSESRAPRAMRPDRVVSLRVPLSRVLITACGAAGASLCAMSSREGLRLTLDALLVSRIGSRRASLALPGSGPLGRRVAAFDPFFFVARVPPANRPMTSREQHAPGIAAAAALRSLSA